jgi:hypothetical protein
VAGTHRSEASLAGMLPSALETHTSGALHCRGPRAEAPRNIYQCRRSKCDTVQLALPFPGVASYCAVFRNNPRY